MKILAIDTSSKNCSVTIVEADKNKFNTLILEESDDERTHSQKIMPIIQNIFLKTNLSLDNIDLLACTIGPGSFTGIRIGVATVKAFSDAKKIPIVGVTSLESLSYNQSEDGYIIPIIDAKHDNVYSALFSLKNNEYTINLENIADNINNVLNNFYKYINSNSVLGNIYFVGDGSIEYKDIILNKFSDMNITFSDKNIQSSISLAKCAYKKYTLGLYGDANSISPIYLKKSQAERFANGEK